MDSCLKPNLFHIKFLMYLDKCVPYSEKACRDAANSLGLDLGDNEYDFAGNYSTKGCYAYNNGKYEGSAYYGYGGTTEQMETSLEDPKFRPDKYDCSLEGKI